MLPKPKPKEELVATRFENSEGIRLTPHSNDAREFISKNAHEFGNVLQLSDGKYILYVKEGYDTQEVLQYFLSYND